MSYDCFCDYDAPNFYRQEIRKARKTFRCEECSGRITPGERYEFVSGCWDHQVSTIRTCERCYDLRQWVKNNVPCLCWAHGNLTDDLREAVEEAAYRAPQETVGLRFGFARRLVMRDRHNGQRRAA